ncbi:hypothetical protein PPERSA_08731 [Pseudocohnilembus persalinus]|uniref:Uncharacterized protein n=1 Tax=Pseudocohnilembus persalinus TaxID=266149 RepID=A0A0V0QXY4_PSEPJ|nr:hypothetical protein PPERSA_08731 [Pseudocohnilembus persalinus]|eukprot:KRX07054.1 hypothetical protein PPERSA_08731 [Pseudocohnilembus persalinus]
MNRFISTHQIIYKQLIQSGIRKTILSYILQYQIKNFIFNQNCLIIFQQKAHNNQFNIKKKKKLKKILFQINYEQNFQIMQYIKFQIKFKQKLQIFFIKKLPQLSAPMQPIIFITTEINNLKKFIAKTSQTTLFIL